MVSISIMVKSMSKDRCMASEDSAESLAKFMRAVSKMDFSTAGEEKLSITITTQATG